MTHRIGSIHEEIAKLQVELGTLEPELAKVIVQIKARNAQQLQLYTQAKALDNWIVPLAEKRKPLEHVVETNNKGLAETDTSWTSILHKFQVAWLPPPVGNFINFIA